jgi:hypothetical protein
VQCKLRYASVEKVGCALSKVHPSFKLRLPLARGSYAELHDCSPYSVDCKSRVVLLGFLFHMYTYRSKNVPAIQGTTSLHTCQVDYMCVFSHFRAARGRDKFLELINNSAGNKHKVHEESFQPITRVARKGSALRRALCRFVTRIRLTHLLREAHSPPSQHDPRPGALLVMLLHPY